MLLERRRDGSQRPMASVKLQFWPNVSGQGGQPFILFKGDDDVWYSLVPETQEEVTRLLSEAHIVHHNTI